MNRSPLRTLLAFMACATLGWAGTAGARSAPQEIPLAPYLGTLVMLDVSSHGQTEHFLLDTAGGVTVVTPAFAQMSGCKVWGQVTGFRMRGQRLDLPRCDDVTLEAAGVRLDAPTAAVWDLASVFPKDAPALAGSIALDAFAGKLVTLDLGHQRLIIETASSLATRIRGAREIPTHFAREVGGLALTPTVGVETAAGRIWMELDSGSDGSVIVNRPLAAALGLDPTMKGGQPLNMTLSGGLAVTTRARVEDLILDGNIGLPLLRQWVVTVDLAHQRMWIVPGHS